MPEVIVPYQGGKVVLTEAAQAASKAAEEWSTVDPGLTNALTKSGKNNLDTESQNNLNELRRQMRSNPPRPATIVSLLPFPLTFGAGNRWMGALTVPACNPGDGTPAYLHVRGYKIDWAYNENGSLKFFPILPIQRAAQFLREFSNNDAFGCGVIIYEGEGHPDKVDEVETYAPDGRALTNTKRGWDQDDEGNRIPADIETPIRAKLATLIESERKKRNAVFLNRVQRADHDYKLPDGRGKWLINDVHFKMADVLFAEGVITKKPDWNLQSRLEQGMAAESCPCGNPVKKESAWCGVCGHILNPLEAYKAGKIEFGHAAFDLMTTDELEEADEIRKEREKKHEAVQKKMAEIKKEKGNKPAKD